MPRYSQAFDTIAVLYNGLILHFTIRYEHWAFTKENKHAVLGLYHIIFSYFVLCCLEKVLELYSSGRSKGIDTSNVRFRKLRFATPKYISALRICEKFSYHGEHTSQGL